MAMAPLLLPASPARSAPPRHCCARLEAPRDPAAESDSGRRPHAGQESHIREDTLANQAPSPGNTGNCQPRQPCGGSTKGGKRKPASGPAAMPAFTGCVVPAQFPQPLGSCEAGQRPVKGCTGLGSVPGPLLAALSGTDTNGKVGVTLGLFSGVPELVRWPCPLLQLTPSPTRHSPSPSGPPLTATSGFYGNSERPAVVAF